MPEQSPTPKSEAPTPANTASGGTGSNARLIVRWLVFFLALFIIGFFLAIIIAFFSPGAAVGIALFRDFLIILLALEGLLVGAALIILILQLARLINLLQNEVRPILEQTNDTVKTMKGTAAFLSHNVADPVIRVGGFVAWLTAILGEVLSIFRITR